MELSVIIPVYNEEDNIKPMVEALESALTNSDYEIIFVDDGSSDNTVDNIRQLSADKPSMSVICFRRNFGQTSAIAAGIEHANGEYIATLDGDLQNDPSDIPMMLAKLQEEQLDLVTGIRAKRQDAMMSRKLPSLAANYLIRRLTGVHIHDYGCTLKVFRADLAKSLELYGELHRFIPVLATIEGAKIAQVDVKHHARRFGVAKYGMGRTLKVFSDLLFMAFSLKYRQKPMHLFGGIGCVMSLSGLAIEFYLLILKCFGSDIGGRPLFYIGILLLIAGLQLITTGFLAELMMRTYFESQHKKPYRIAKIFRAGRLSS